MRRYPNILVSVMPAVKWGNTIWVSELVQQSLNMGYHSHF